MLLLSPFPRAKTALYEVAQKLNADHDLHKHPLTLTVSGLSSFGEKVVFADIAEREKLQKVAGIIYSIMVCAFVCTIVPFASLGSRPSPIYVCVLIVRELMLLPTCHSVPLGLLLLIYNAMLIV